MKARVYKLSSGEVVVDVPARRYQGKIEECPHPWRFRDSNPNKEPFEVEVKELAEIENIASGNEGGSAQFYYDGADLKHDDNWEENLMPVPSIIQRKKQRLNKILDAELSKDSPDPVAIIRLDRMLKHLRSITEKQAYEWALKTLKDENIKANIQKKLQERIDEL